MQSLNSSVIRSIARTLSAQHRVLVGVLPLALMAVLLSACVTTIPAQPAGEAGALDSTQLSDIANYQLPDPEAVIVPDVTAVVNTEGSRANVRTGPQLDAPIIAKATPGDEYKVTGKTEDGEWWQICCVRGLADAEGEATEPAWVAATVVDLDGDADAVPVVEAFMPESLEATWRFEWNCGSERCEIKECGGTVTAAAEAAAG